VQRSLFLALFLKLIHQRRLPNDFVDPHRVLLRARLNLGR
jgi:hypothetical protein